MHYDECTGWEQVSNRTSCPDTIYEDPLGQAILSNPYHLDIELCEEHPELKPETYGFTKQDYKRKIFSTQKNQNY